MTEKFWNDANRNRRLNDDEGRRGIKERMTVKMAADVGVDVPSDRSCETESESRYLCRGCPSRIIKMIIKSYFPKKQPEPSHWSAATGKMGPLSFVGGQRSDRSTTQEEGKSE